MIEESAQVIRIHDDFAWIETRRKSACGGCAVNKGCGISVLVQLFGKRRTEVKVLNNIDACVGDDVIIGIEENALVNGSLAVYAVPVISMISGAILGELLAQYWSIQNIEAASIAGGLVGLAAGFQWVKGFTRRVSRDTHYQPVILRKIVKGVAFGNVKIHNEN
ncbi:MAG: SoxR-reducing system protein RseC [Gammaproteobacteria bacterium]|nr:MAG: SoxR-reducing system protein RseC [Gammaproteobacteria bacterium]